MKSLAIECEYGSGGYEIGKAISRAENIPLYDGEALLNECERCGNPLRLLENYGVSEADDILHSIAVIEGFAYNDGSKARDNFNALARTVKALNRRGAGVFCGHGAAGILEDCKNVVRVFIYSSDTDERIRRAANLKGITEDEAGAMIRSEDARREMLFLMYSSSRWKNGGVYDLSLNASRLSVESCVRILTYEMNAEQRREEE